MLASQSSMVRDYRELSYFFEMIDLKVTNTTNLDDHAKALLGSVLLTGNVESLPQFSTNRYFIDAIGISEIPDMDKLELGSCTNQLANFLHQLDGTTAPDGEDSALTISKRIYQWISGATDLDSINNFWNEEKRNFFAENGYVIFENFLPESECDAYRKEVYAIAEQEREAGSAFLYGYENSGQRIYNLINKTRAYDDLLMDRRLSFILNDIFARPTYHQLYVMSSWHANILSPGAKKQVLHVDASVPEPLPPWIIRLNVNFIVEDYTSENGATLCAPGTHKWLRKPTKEDIEQTADQLVTLSAPKGSIVIWHGHLWHQSGHNRSAKDRVALLACYAASHLLEVAMEENHASVIDGEQKQNMGSNLRNLFGLNHGIK